MFFDLLRRKQKSILTFVLIGFAALLMVSFGLDTYQMRGAQRPPAIKVDGKEITFEEYHRQYEELASRYRQQFGAQFDTFKNAINISQQATDYLINDHLFQNLVDGLKLTASSHQVEARLRSLPIFADGFSREKWQQFLQLQGMNERAIEESTKREIVRSQIVNTFSALGFPSDPELQAIYERDKSKRAFRFVKLRDADFENKVSITDEAVAKYFDAHKEEFQIPRAVKLAFVKFEPSQFTDRVEVTQDDLEQTYREHRLEFVEPSKIRAQVITIEKAASSDAEKKSDPLKDLLKPEEKAAEPSAESKLDSNEARRAKLKEVVEKIQSGGDRAQLFETLLSGGEPKAAKRSFEWQEISAFPEHLRKAAADLQVGEISNVIDGPDGYSVIFVEDLKERREKPLEEVKGEIEKIFRNANAEIYQNAHAEDFYRRAQGSELPLADFAAKENLAVQKPADFISAESTVAGVPPSVRDRALQLDNNTKELISADADIFVIEVVETRTEQIPELSGVKDQVVKAFKTEESKRLAREQADQLLAEAKTQSSSDPLLAVAEKHQFPSEKTELMIHAEAKGEFLVSPENIDTAFALSSEEPVAPRVLETPNAHFVVALNQYVSPDQKDFEKERTQLVRQETEGAGSRLLESLIETQRAAADVWVDPELSDNPNTPS